MFRDLRRIGIGIHVPSTSWRTDSYYYVGLRKTGTLATVLKGVEFLHGKTTTQRCSVIFNENWGLCSLGEPGWVLARVRSVIPVINED